MKIKTINVDLTLPWGILWLFTLGMCHLGLWKGVLAFFIWPYFVGDVVASSVGR